MTDDMSVSKAVAAAKLPAARKLTFSTLVMVAVPACKTHKFPQLKDLRTKQVGYYMNAEMPRKAVLTN